MSVRLGGGGGGGGVEKRVTLIVKSSSRDVRLNANITFYLTIST